MDCLKSTILLTQYYQITQQLQVLQQYSSLPSSYQPEKQVKSNFVLNGLLNYVLKTYKFYLLMMIQSLVVIIYMQVHNISIINRYAYCIIDDIQVNIPISWGCLGGNASRDHTDQESRVPRQVGRQYLSKYLLSQIPIILGQLYHLLLFLVDITTK